MATRKRARRAPRRHSTLTRVSTLSAPKSSGRIEPAKQALRRGESLYRLGLLVHSPGRVELSVRWLENGDDERYDRGVEERRRAETYAVALALALPVGAAFGCSSNDAKRIRVEIIEPAQMSGSDYRIGRVYFSFDPARLEQEEFDPSSPGYENLCWVKQARSKAPPTAGTSREQ
jgi:hypothetical protein